MEKMINHAPVSVDHPKFSDPHTKVNALLQAHFSRERLSGDLGNDTRTAVRESARLLQVRACVLPHGAKQGRQQATPTPQG